MTMGSHQTSIGGMRSNILIGDCRAHLPKLPAQSAHLCATSPSYYQQRDYGMTEQIGLEKSPDEYVAEMVSVFREVRRVLRDDGTLFLNLGDSYASSTKGSGGTGKSTLGPASGGNGISDAGVLRSQTRQGMPVRRMDMSGLKPKDLVGIPWRVAFALQADGWLLRDAIVWAKPNGMPGSQKDRCTSSYEMIFHLSKSANYWSDFDAIKTPPRESSLIRTAQDVQAQAGSHRANGGGKTNGAMKAVGVKAASSTLEGSGHGRHSYGNVPPKERRTDKQRWHSRQHAGFNDRWDAMKRAEQMSRPAMMRNVWFVSPSGYDEAHFAVMPDEIARRCILAGCPEGGHVLDPFGGAGTTALVAALLPGGRTSTIIELNPDYAKLAQVRIEAAFMGKESGARHIAKQLGKDRVPFERGTLFSGIEAAAE
jgi:DNA modification methylase